MYHVRRVNIGKTAQLDELAHACGELYSKMLVFFWQMVRHKRRWLKPKHLMPQYKPSLLPLRVGGSATRRIQPPNLCASASGREPPRSVTSVYASGKNIVPKKYGFSDPVLMELPAGLFGGSSWDGHDTTRCGSSRVLLSVCIKGKRKLKVCIL
jgi:hypothetical protein